MEKESRRVNLELIISLSIVMVTILGSTIPLYIHTSNQIDALRIESRDQLWAIQEEIRDFHGKLCAIEEKNKK